MEIFRGPEFVPNVIDLSVLRSKSIGVTGHRGNLGGRLVRRLQSAGAQVNEFDGNILDRKAVSDWCENANFDYVFNFAAVVPIAKVDHDPIIAYDTNVIGVFNLCSAILKLERDCWFFQC
jgi:nucleoside-diphosphate-sugar epimerase